LYEGNISCLLELLPLLLCPRRNTRFPHVFVDFGRIFRSLVLVAKPDEDEKARKFFSAAQKKIGSERV
jgi:hypothetical protein